MNTKLEASAGVGCSEAVDADLPVAVNLSLDLLRRAILEPHRIHGDAFAATADRLASEAVVMLAPLPAIEVAQMQLKQDLQAFGAGARSSVDQTDALAAVNRFAAALAGAPPSEYAKRLGMNW